MNRPAPRVYTAGLAPPASAARSPMPAPDVLIVGGGVIGLSCARELVRRGRTVRVLERDAVGARTGAASWAGAGMLPACSPAAARTPGDRLRAFSHSLWDDWAASLEDAAGLRIGYERCGAVEVTHPEFGGPTPKDNEKGGGEPGPPWLSRDAAVVADRPAGGQVRNPRLLRALRSAVEAAGGAVGEGAAVARVRVVKNRTVGVYLENGELAPAGAVLVCGGAWSGGLLEVARRAVPVRPVRGQMALLDCGVRPFRPVVECGGRYLVPRDDGRVLAGATQEEAGFRAETTAGGVAGLLDFARALVPSLADARVERAWAGLRPATPDGNPLLGAVPGVDRLFVAAGHFRDGLQQSPGTAAILADLIEAKTSLIDLGGLTPDRFDVLGRPVKKGPN